MTRTGNRILPKYTDESLDDYDDRVERTKRMRADQTKRFLDENEPDEPIESLLDKCERLWGTNK